MMLAYGLFVYVVFLCTFVYFIGFAAGFSFMPTSVDSGEQGATGPAILVNLGILTVFAVQHFIMARPWFKARWIRIVPVTIERSTFVFVTTLLVMLLVWQWRPMPEMIWEITNPLGHYGLWALWAIGWVIMLYSTFLIDHFDLFGLRQVYLHARGIAYTPVQFKMRSLYRHVRHPMMVGFIIAFWATPTMSAGHLLLAIATTGMILVGTQLEERDLLRAHAGAYLDYRRRVPMLIPGFRAAAPISGEPAVES